MAWARLTKWRTVLRVSLPSDLEAVLVGWHTRTLSPNDIIAWAAREMSEGRRHPCLPEIVRSRRDEGKISECLEELTPEGFSPEDHVAIAKDLWISFLSCYIEGQGAPRHVLEALYRIEDLYDMPEWLGQMYNACDWSDETSRREDWPQIEDEARRLIATYD